MIAQTEKSALQKLDNHQYEVDSIDDVFGILYRVWGGEKGSNLKGTFYQNLDGAWVSQPCDTTERGAFVTSIQAIAAILGTCHEKN